MKAGRSDWRGGRTLCDFPLVSASISLSRDFAGWGTTGYNRGVIIPATKTPWLLNLFSQYTRRYLQRNFHAVHRFGEIPNGGLTENIPLIVAINHSSWWDVLLGLIAAEDFFTREWYGVMDARQLERYKFFAKLGMIGVDRVSLTGAKEFLAYSETLLKNQPRALWLTPQGEMLSNQRRPIRFQPGIGHLAERLGDFYFTTIVFHYEFWNEKRPEAFLSLSAIERVHVGADFKRREFVAAQEQRIERQLDELLAAVQSRDAALFHPLLRGATGISATYDLIRAVGARLRGEAFRSEHSEIATPQWKQTAQSHRDEISISDKKSDGKQD